MTTEAAETFIRSVSISWDSRDPWEATALQGLADVDEDALRSLCEQSGDDYPEAEAEVLAYIRAKVSES